MKSIVVFLFMLIAGLGFLFTLAVHLASVVGAALLPGEPWFAIGIFVVWPPTILCGNALAKEFPRRDRGKALLRGCPKPMQYGLYGVLAYGLLNSALFLATTDEASRSSTAPIRGFSAHALIFGGDAGAGQHHDPTRLYSCAP